MSLDSAVISPLMIEGLMVRVPSSGKPITSAAAPDDGTDGAKVNGEALVVDTRRIATSLTGSKNATCADTPPTVTLVAPATTCALVTTRCDVMKNPVPWWVSAQPIARTLTISLGEFGDSVLAPSFRAGPDDGTVGATMLANTLGKSALRSIVWRRASAEGT